MMPKPQRLQASWVSASEGGKFAEVVADVTRDLKETGPNRLFADERDRTEATE
ncbi:hydrogenase [Chloroflexota bacterium]